MDAPCHFAETASCLESVPIADLLVETVVLVGVGLDCIDKVQRRATGYRNVANFKDAIYLHGGKLDLYPSLCS